MNRRSFFTKLGLAAATLAILPTATTYSRNWVKKDLVWVANPEWETAPYEISFIWNKNACTLIKEGNPMNQVFFTKAGDFVGRRFKVNDFGQSVEVPRLVLA